MTTITSIGAGMIMYGVLSPFLDLKVVIPLVAPAQLLAVGLRCWLFRRHSMAPSGPLLPAWCPAFTPVRSSSTSSPRRRISDVFLLAFAACEMWQDSENRTTFLPLGGVVAGALLGSIGIAGGDLPALRPAA